MTKQRKQPRPLGDRLATFAEYVRDQAKRLPRGPEREQMLKKARQAKVAEDIDKWMSSPGPQPPK